MDFLQRKRNVAPVPAADSTHARPRCDSTIFFTSARPMPAPSTRSRASSVWKMPQMRSWNSGAMPGPLSLTENS